MQCPLECGRKITDLIGSKENTKKKTILRMNINIGQNCDFINITQCLRLTLDLPFVQCLVFSFGFVRWNASYRLDHVIS